MPRFGLSLKILLGTAAVVTAVLVVTLAVTSASARSSAIVSIERGLGETNARIAEQLQARQDKVAGKVGAVALNRDVMLTILNDTVGNDAFEQSQEIVRSSGAKWVQVTDKDGKRLAKSDNNSAPRG